MPGTQDGRNEQRKEWYFWEVAGGRAEMYLFGTLHIAQERLFPLPQQILRAFDACEQFVCEAGLDPKSVERVVIDEHLLEDEDNVYPVGDSLYKHYPYDKVKKLKKKLMDEGICSSALDSHFYKLKPEVVEAMQTKARFKKMGVDIEKIGIDYYLLKKARKAKKGIMELEGTKQQRKILCRSLGEDEGTYFKQTAPTLRFKERPGLFLEKMWVKLMTDYYSSGDIRLLERGLSPNDPLVGSRNKEMCNKLKGLLRTDGSYFVAVGAMHLAGTDNIIEMLQNQGYVVHKIL